MSLKMKWMVAFNYDKKETPRIFATKGDYLLWSKDKVTAVTPEDYRRFWCIFVAIMKLGTEELPLEMRYSV